MIEGAKTAPPRSQACPDRDQLGGADQRLCRLLPWKYLCRRHLGVR